MNQGALHPGARNRGGAKFVVPSGGGHHRSRISRMNVPLRSTEPWMPTIANEHNGVKFNWVWVLLPYHVRSGTKIGPVFQCLKGGRDGAIRMKSVKPRPQQQQCRSNVRLCRSNIRFCQTNRSTCNIPQCCFDFVAGVHGALHCLYALELRPCLSVFFV